MAKATFNTYSSKGEVVKLIESQTGYASNSIQGSIGQTGYASNSIQGAIWDSSSELDTLTHLVDTLADRLRDVSTAADSNGDSQPSQLSLGDCALATQVMSIADRLRQANNRLTAVLQDLRL